MAANAMTSGGERRKRQKKFLCGLSQGDCCGSYVTMPYGSRKAHGSPEEAFKCYANFLLRDGYKQIGSREFVKGDGPILVLTKKSHFGQMLRGGKAKAFVFKRTIAGGII